MNSCGSQLQSKATFLYKMNYAMLLYVFVYKSLCQHLVSFINCLQICNFHIKHPDLILNGFIKAEEASVFSDYLDEYQSLFNENTFTCP